jgi:3-deoxy-D-manno-octulosonate 8-phosphate phosphatase (KDO 8-P phosphatase)
MDDVVAADLATRLARVKLVICDNDGVLTDGRVYVSERGEELKAYSLRDGMGVERLRDAGITTSILTRESTNFVRRRAEKIGIRYVWQGVKDKRAALDRIMEETGVPANALAYMGDDVNDLEIMKVIAIEGVTAVPNDAMEQVRQVAHVICEQPGGRGAFREFAELILRSVTSQQ